MLKDKNIELVLIPLLKDTLQYRGFIRFLEAYISESLPDPYKSILLKILNNVTDVRQLIRLITRVGIEIPGVHMLEDPYLIENYKNRCLNKAVLPPYCEDYANNIIQGITGILNKICSE